MVNELVNIQASHGLVWVIEIHRENGGGLLGWGKIAGLTPKEPLKRGNTQ